MAFIQQTTPEQEATLQGFAQRRDELIRLMSEAQLEYDNLLAKNKELVNSNKSLVDASENLIKNKDNIIVPLSEEIADKRVQLVALEKEYQITEGKRIKAQQELGAAERLLAQTVSVQKEISETTQNIKTILSEIVVEMGDIRKEAKEQLNLIKNIAENAIVGFKTFEGTIINKEKELLERQNELNIRENRNIDREKAVNELYQDFINTAKLNKFNIEKEIKEIPLDSTIISKKS